MTQGMFALFKKRHKDRNGMYSCVSSQGHKSFELWASLPFISIEPVVTITQIFSSQENMVVHGVSGHTDLTV